MQSNETLQYCFIERLIKKQSRVSIFLSNGICLHGIVLSHDNEVIILKDIGWQLVYKHSIASILPNKAIKT